ncbi:unnamed protein product [Owenia fusiformis]|uniref:Uncharacterized protein n=1 Tax=Owenia fusiformis TaxID=6347 RepID=A0A8J1UAD0_OWEFU|nr:unnamed protein product [Owenia fusiformis]
MYMEVDGYVLLMVLHITGATNHASQCNTTTHCPAQCHCDTLTHTGFNDTILQVNCTNTSLTEMPHSVPCQDSDIKYHILLNNNRIHTLVYHTYLHNTMYLNMGDNTLSNVTQEAVAAMVDIQQLHIQNNRLASLPKVIRNLTNLEELSLHANPWDCNCDKMWFIEWTREIQNILTNKSQIKCSISKIELLKITPAQMQCKDKKEHRHLLAPYVIAIIIIVLLYLIISSIIAIFVTIRRRQKTEIINHGEGKSKTSVFTL